MILATGDGGRLLDFKGKLQIRAKAVPNELRNLEFAHEDLIQHWQDRDHFKLHIWLRGEVHLVIDTKWAPDDMRYVGHYELEILGATEKALTIGGRATCM